MLATFVIGLREGLEAALIVGIIAAFLRRNGRSLTPMMLGVGAAVLVSLGVGVSLKILETSLPQAQQEALETVIGLVAVVFVSTMVIWMNRHARGLKGELEHAAADALGAGSARALVGMAFLAVLKEGFETSVFLLATFSAASNTALAVTGAVLGIAVAVGIGYGLYTGGVRLNLGKFFTWTSAFLVLVAAGLLVSTVTTAHEAGWLDAGQQRTVDLSWLTPPGTIQGAIFTGLLGIPADPRLVEVIAWFAYVLGMGAFLFWPRTHRPSARTAVRLRYGIGGALVVLAGGLALFVGPATMPSFGPAPLLAADGTTAGTIAHSAGTVELTDASGATSTALLTAGTGVAHAGVPDATEYAVPLHDAGEAALPQALTIEQLVAVNGGRLPVGVSPQTAPGPYQAAWTHSGEARLWLAGAEVLDFTSTEQVTLTLSGGGLVSPRTFTVTGTLPDGTRLAGSVAVDPGRTQAVAAAATATRLDQVERQFWGRTVPVLLLACGLLLLVLGRRAQRRLEASAAVDRPEAPTTRPAAPAQMAAQGGN